MTGLRWGILATGGIAHAFASAIRSAGLDIAAVGSRSAESAGAFAEQFDIPRAHPSYDALIADPEIDVIYIATPHTHHARFAIQAIEAGKHVLVEKAFTLNRPEAERVRDAARAHGRFVMEAMWARYLPHMVRIRQIIASGMIGEVRALIADHSQQLPTDPAHRINALELGGGAILDLGVYPISFAFDLFGTPSSVHAHGRLKDTGADADVAITFGYDNGAIASLYATSMSHGPTRAAILGSNGSIEIDRVWYAPSDFRVLDAKGVLIESYTSADREHGLKHQALALEDYVASGLSESPLLGLDESVEVMGAMDEIRRQIGVRYPGE